MGLIFVDGAGESTGRMVGDELVARASALKATVLGWIRALVPDRGQGALEMALTVPIVFTVIMGCLELGMAFNGYVTLAAAAREGARSGAIYLYDSSSSESANDQNRETGTGASVSYTDNIRDTVAGSLGILKNASPYFDKNSDVTISYTPSAGSTLTRKGDLVSVQVHYHYTPMSQFLGGGNTITMTAQASAIIE